MYLDVKSVGQHMKVSKAADKVALFTKEAPERRQARQHFTALAYRTRDMRPRLVKPAEPVVVSLADFLASRPVVETSAVEYVPADQRSFDKREAVAQEAGL